MYSAIGSASLEAVLFSFHKSTQTKSNQKMKMKQKGFTLIELLVVIAIIGILASMLLPTLAKAKKKANRLKCTSNLGSVGKGFTTAADEHEGAMPWMMTVEDGNAAYRAHIRNKANGGNDYRYGNWGWVRYIQHVWFLPAVRNSLDSCKTLASPSDPAIKRENDIEYARVPAHDKTHQGWGIRNYRNMDNNHLSHRGQSYAICLAGDTLAGDSILATTRNIDGDARHKNGKETKDMGGTTISNMPVGQYFSACNQWRQWIGSRHHMATHMAHSSSGMWTDPGDSAKGGTYLSKYIMSGLDADQGNTVLSDGSTKQANNVDLAEQIKKHSEVTGGTLTQQNTALIRPNTR